MVEVFMGACAPRDLRPLNWNLSSWQILPSVRDRTNGELLIGDLIIAPTADDVLAELLRVFLRQNERIGVALKQR